MGAQPLESPHLVWSHSGDVYTGARLVQDGGFPCWSHAHISVQDGYGARLFAPLVDLNDTPVVQQQELQVVPYSCSHRGGEAPLAEYVLGTRVAVVLRFP